MRKTVVSGLVCQEISLPKPGVSFDELLRQVERERDDANRALEMERAAHRATAARVEKASEVLRAIHNLDEHEQSLEAFELSGSALDALGCA